MQTLNLVLGIYTNFIPSAWAPLLKITRTLQEERTYLNSLEHLYTLKRVLKEHEHLSWELYETWDLYKTFGRIDQIFDLHLEFSLHIENAERENTESKDTDLSDTLYLLRHRFHSCYIPYIGNHKRSLETAVKFYNDHTLGSNKAIPPELRSTTENLTNFSMSLAKPVVQFYNYITYLKVGNSNIIVISIS